LLQEEVSYEQQIQGRLNEKKLTTVKELNRAMQEQEHRAIIDTDLKTLVKTLNDFFIAQENDRLHMVTVYKKLKAFFPEQIKERSQSIINHFDSIDKTINETTAVFSAKFKLLSKCVLPLLREHLKRYTHVRDESKVIGDEIRNLKTSYVVADLRPTPASFIKLGSSNDKADNSLNNINLNTKNTNFEYYDEYDGDSDDTDASGEIDDDLDESDEKFDDDFDDYDDDEAKNNKILPNTNEDNVRKNKSNYIWKNMHILITFGVRDITLT